VLIDAFLAGLSKESYSDFCSLLLATLPDPSVSHAEVEAISYTKGKERGFTPADWGAVNRNELFLNL
jgi:hypothetical protein